MKLIFLFLIISLIQVAASTKAQTITLNKQNISITAVFEEIMMQSDYDFSYSEQQISKVGRINISVTNASINEVLEKCFEGQLLTYTISNNTITIKDIPRPFFKRILKPFSTVIISGTVSDAQGNVLPRATVKLQGSKTTTRTDDKGFFTINSDEEIGVLNISFLGFVSERISFSSNNLGPFKVVLKQETSGLEEIEINAGYYTVKDKERTGSISRITSAEIEKQPINNPLQALQGRIAGVEIVQNTGVPGGSFNVRIRGRNSIANGNDPLYIINGVPIPTTLSTNIGSQIIRAGSTLSSINPNDIESIEILKDADATAIYGSRGANGVVLITTKKGTAGSLKLDVDFNQGFGNVGRKINLLNTTQYLEMRNEAFLNDNLSPESYDYDVNGTWDLNRYTDWQKELIGGTAKMSNAHLSISGGNEYTTFLGSGHYYKETTVYPGDKNYHKKSGMLTINHKSNNSEFSIQATAGYTREDSSLPLNDLTNWILLPPNAPSGFTQEGNLNWENGTFLENPYGFLLQSYDSNSGTLNASTNLNYMIIPGLELSARISYSRIESYQISRIPLASYNPVYGLDGNYREGSYGDNRTQTLNFEPQISWTTNVGKGKFNILTGATIQQNNLRQQTIVGNGYVSDDLLENVSAASKLTARDAVSSVYRYQSVYARFNFSIKDKYYLNITGRRDGSSRFGPEHLFANFGAIGAAWIFSNEKLIAKHLPFLSFGKIRSSYGITGNDQIGDYNFLELWNPTSNNYQGKTGLYPFRLQNPAYAWESNKKMEFALDLGFFQDNLRISTAYYVNKSSNQLIRYNLAPSTGFLNVMANLPATVQNTGFEIEAFSEVLDRNSFRWTSSLNLSIPRNKLIDFPNLDVSSYANTYVLNQPLNILKSWKYTGVDQNIGLYTFQDFDGNRSASFPNDNQIAKFIGQKYSGGFQNNFSYRNWEFDFLLQYVKQSGRNYRSNIGTAPGGMSNQPQYVLDRWQKNGDITDIQKYTISAGTSTYSNGRTFGDFTVSDASFVRLKNITLSYRFQERLLTRNDLKQAKVYIQGQNLLTLTNYQGLDPESQSFYVLPPLRIITAGLQITF